jgi:serine/threonine-protein kinase
MTKAQIGSEFIGYRIEDAVGRGGMGVVYRAYDLRLKRTVALKLVTPELSLDERFRERFAQETELAMALEHPNVVPIHDAGDVDGRLYLAMRFVVGSDLRALLRTEGALEPERALAICRQVAAALDAAHARGLVHGDVKPSNVLLDENEHVYLADFGLTRRLDEQADGRFAGSPAYLAPEQLEGKPADERSDIYALGCVLFECLTGAPPFGGESRLEVAWAHLEEEPPPPSKRRPRLPAALDGVIARALAKMPEERYPQAADLVTAAERALGLRRAPSIGKRTVVVVAAVVLGLVGALAVALAVRGGGRSAQPLLGNADTLVRLDPRTNDVERVIDVPGDPVALASRGRIVWVYSEAADVVSEIDTRRNLVVKSTPVSVEPVDLNIATGPVLAADANGAWVVGADQRGRSMLSLVLPGGGRRDYRLAFRPEGVATGLAAVWVVGRGPYGDELLRLDPATGTSTVQARFPVSAGVDSITVAFREVWLVSSGTATVYRVDPRLGSVDHMSLGRRAGPPNAAFGGIWIGLIDYGGAGDTVVLNPRSLERYQDLGCCGVGPDVGAFGSVWGYDAKDGSVQRWNPETYGLSHLTHVTDPPFYDGSCISSIAAGTGAIWVTLQAAIDYRC